MHQALFRIIAMTMMTFIFVRAFAQPLPCDMLDPQMEPTCEQACIICDIDGFTGRHQSDIPGVLPPDFCTFTVHNAQWIAFQAASTFLEIEMAVSNCETNIGLEITIYKGTNCDNFEMISNCNGGRTGNQIMEGSSAILRTTEPLVIGQHYYLAMDGALADNCDWTFTVLQGSTEADPLTVTAPIQGERRVCPDVPQRYTTEPEVGAVLFDWELEGEPIGDPTNPFVDITFTETGLFNLCVTARNVCDTADPTCQLIEVFIIPDTEISDVFCQEDCYEIDGMVFCETGIFTYDIPLANGCDSTIILDLVQLEQPVTNLSFNICEGDAINIGENSFSETGAFSEIVLSELMCDSIVNLDLFVVLCNIQSSYTASDPVCNGDSNGSITFNVDNGTAPFTFTWQHLQAGTEGSGMISTVSENSIIENLPAGDVIIEISDGFGNLDIITAEVEEPPVLTMESMVSEFNGFQVSCSSSTDGQIEILAAGGTPPYSYDWNDGSTTNIIANLNAGMYTVTLTDDAGCVLVEEFELTEPREINANFVFSDPSCDGLESGSINLTSINGGVGNFEYAINGTDFSGVSTFANLPAGSYDVRVRDDNNCTDVVSNVLNPISIPMLPNEFSYDVLLGCPIQVDLELNSSIVESVIWSNPAFLSCDDCLTPDANPLNSTMNTVTINSFDNCERSADVFFNVEKRREFYAPNSFSPNGDGTNESFTLFGGKEVQTIDLTVFDRWGSLVYRESGITNEDNGRGWNGDHNFSPAIDGVYVWRASILFIDGESDNFSGTVMLTR